MTPSSLTQWLIAPLCGNCGRPRLLLGLVNTLGNIPAAGSDGSLGLGCWHHPLDGHIRSTDAAKCHLGSLAHVLPLSTLRQPCPVEYPLPDLHPSYLPARAAFPQTAPLPETPTSAAEPLRVLTVNCEGLTKKVERLVALLQCTQADIVCLQETGYLLAVDDLPGLGYTVYNGPAVHGGGLCTLLRSSPFQSLGLDVVRSDHMLGVAAALTSACQLRVVNLHLPPSLSGPARREICTQAAVFAGRPPAGIRPVVRGTHAPAPCS
jgi:hypothetical protein